MNKENIDKEKISSYSGILGILINLLLSLAKYLLGNLCDSIAIISDAFNNLTDVFNALAVYIGNRIVAKPADKEHPYGHGRLEYILSQGIGCMIILVGMTLLRNSIERILHPKSVLSNPHVLIVYIISLAVKIALAFVYDWGFRHTGNRTLKAQKIDSLSDCAGIIVIACGYLMNGMTSFPLDGLIGVFVSGLIIYSGAMILKDMISLLMGKAADEKLTEKIAAMVVAEPGVYGVHDLLVHDYGNGKLYGTCDIEIDGGQSLFEAHDLIDILEKKIHDELDIRMSIHGDPVSKDRSLDKYRKAIGSLLHDIDPSIGFHDLHFNRTAETYSIDLEMPYNLKVDENDLAERIRSLFKDQKIDITIDRI